MLAFNLLSWKKGWFSISATSAHVRTRFPKSDWLKGKLTVFASVIYMLYRIRWQIELVFKGCKCSLNPDEKMTTNNDNIIGALILSSIIASFALHIVFQEG